MARRILAGIWTAAVLGAVLIGAAPGSAAADEADAAKIAAFVARHTGEPAHAPGSVEMVDLNGDGQDEALVILGGAFCGARYCDGFVLELSGPEAREIGAWLVATMRAGSTRLNGWRDIVVNDTYRRFDGARYD